MPPGVIMDQDSCNADYLVLEFWRGTISVGSCKLPINRMKEAAASQVPPQALLLSQCPSATPRTLTVSLVSRLHRRCKQLTCAPTYGKFLSQVKPH